MPTVSRTRAPLAAPTGLIIAVLCFGSLCGALMQSLVIPIKSELPELLGTNPSNTSWVVTAGAFQLCFAVGALAALVGAGITLLVPRDRPDRTIPPADSGVAADAVEQPAAH